MLGDDKHMRQCQGDAKGHQVTLKKCWGTSSNVAKMLGEVWYCFSMMT